MPVAHLFQQGPIALPHHGSPPGRSSGVQPQMMCAPQLSWLAAQDTSALDSGVAAVIN